MLSFKVESLFRGDLDHKVLDYLKAIGKPDQIIYGTNGSRYTATLIYGKEELKNKTVHQKHIDINL